MNNQLKQYTGTKTVKARPMTMGEAYECKLLKEGVRPSKCETDKAGYLVEYGDGYMSWSPKDVFDAAYKPSETFLERLENECNEIDARSDKVKDFIGSDRFDNLSPIAKLLLVAQCATQREYIYLLVDRIDEAKEKKPFLSEFDFGTALKFLTAGGAINRAVWRSEKIVVKQVPSIITADIIPQVSKDILMSRKNPHISNTNQMLIIHPDGQADSWQPTPEDIFAEDWKLVVPPTH